MRHAKKLPDMPRWWWRRYDSPARPVATAAPQLPAYLVGVPGTRRIVSLEDEAFAREPLHDFLSIHNDSVLYLQRRMWLSVLPASPRLLRARRGIRATERATITAEPNGQLSPAELTTALKRYCADIGMTAVGIAQYNPVYTFAEAAGKHSLDRVIVCILEQNFEATQTAPSMTAERAAFAAYAGLMERTARVAGYLHELGYRAEAHDNEGETIVIYYGEQAGLGQLGRNGQLLTRAVGSRCRISVITTNAPLGLDAPQDYGVQAICDTCNVCAGRCPVGAIPLKRVEYRGVEKSKLNTKRCFPIVAQADGCAICMKVCPVQKFGLDAVIEHLDRTGEILGKGTDDLEGYTWMDGKRYGSGQRPRLPRSVTHPPDFPFIALSDVAATASRSPG
jgi:ferredoxin